MASTRQSQWQAVPRQTRFLLSDIKSQGSRDYIPEAESKDYMLGPAYGRRCFPGGSVVENSPANARDSGLIPGSGRSPGKGDGNPHQYSCLRNPMDRGAWQATVHGVAKSWTQLTEHACIGVNSSTREEPGPVLSRNVRSCRAHKGQKL